MTPLSGRARVAAMLRLAALLTAFLVAALPAHAGKAKDHLVIGITQFPSSFHPNIDSMLAKSYILAMTRRPLTAYDTSWTNICMLCTALPTIENGKAKPERAPNGRKGIAVTYTIHPKATWGDGVPVTTKDVVFTWKVGRHKKSGVSNIEFYRSLYKVDAVDDKTRTAYDTDTTNEGLYFGPYAISEVAPGSHVVLEPNPTWYGEKPHFRKITVRVIENTAALEANLLSGGIDMIAGELGLTVDQAVTFERRHGRKFDILYKPGLIYEHIDLNLDNPILADRRVRHALIHAIDREAISQRLFGGRQPVAHTSVNPLDWVYADDVPKYPFDLKKAAKLLDAAGWTQRRKGIRHNKQGQPLRLEIMTTAGNRSRELVEQVLQSQWKAAGIDVRIRNQPARVFFGQTVTERKFTGLAMYAWISAPESVPRTTLHSAHIPHADNNYAGQNYTGFKNQEMDDLLEVIETELDRAKRKKLWHRLQTIYAGELPVLPLYFRANPFIIPKWLTGIEPTGHQYPTTLWIENWRVR